MNTQRLLIKTVVLVVLLVSFNSCRKYDYNEERYNGSPYDVGSVSAAKEWYEQLIKSKSINNVFKNTDYEWFRATITKFKSGYEEILIPIKEKNQDPRYLGIRKLVINRGFKGNYYAKVIELIPDKEYADKTKEYKGIDFTGLILRWDIFQGYKKGIQVNKGVAIGYVTLDSFTNEKSQVQISTSGAGLNSAVANSVSIIAPGGGGTPTPSPNPSTGYLFQLFMNDMGYNNLYGSGFGSNPCEYDPQCGMGNIEYLTEQYYIDQSVQIAFIDNLLTTVVTVPLEDPSYTFDVDNAYTINYNILTAVTDARGGGTFVFDANFFQQYQSPPSSSNPVLVAWVLKSLGSASADVLAQMVLSKMFQPNVNTWWDAYREVKWTETGIAAAEGFLPWRVANSKWSKAAIAASAVIIEKSARAEWSNSSYSWDQASDDFVLHFFSYMAGQGLGDLVQKFGLSNVAKKLVAQGNIPYHRICRLLGGAGLQAINKSYSHSAAYGGTITAARKISSWGTNKIAVIGRNMDDRVEPFAQNLSNELGIPVATIKQWSGWNSNLTLEQNRQWVRELKEQGYTIYDVGLDPYYTNVLGDYSPGSFYSMELDELF